MAAQAPLTPREEAALAKYFEREYPGMLRFAAAALADRGLAEVAVQDAFLTAALKFADFSQSPEPVGWLYNTLKFKIRRIMADRRKTLERCVPLEDVGDELPARRAPGLSDADGPELRLLVRFYLEGYSLKEIAAEEGCSEAAVKMRLYRARKKLREEL